MSQSLSRAIIAMPGIWYLSFSTKNYNSLFKLRENYAHKFSVVYSVEGLKNISKDSTEKIDEAVIECIIETPPTSILNSKKNTNINLNDLIKEISDLKKIIYNQKK